MVESLWLLRFKSGNLCCGLDPHLVEEIISLRSNPPADCVFIDLGALMKVPNKETYQKAILVTSGMAGKRIGILAESVGELEDFPLSMFYRLPAVVARTISLDFIMGLFVQEDSVCLVLDVEKLVQHVTGHLKT